MKVIVVFGTRPEAIKMCPVINELKKRTNIDHKVVLTGQHREMLDQVMTAFKVEADYDLKIMKAKQKLSDINSRVLDGFTDILIRENPDLVLVHGDTTSSLAAATAAFYQQIPVGHVEAGLRTYDLNEPFPEEFNRQTVDLISSLLFAPTEAAKNNLMQEGKCAEDIFVTGNTVIDALRTTVSEKYIDDNLKWAAEGIFILMTMHRRESIGAPMRQVFCAVKRIAEERKNVRIIYPVHKNPVVRKIAFEILGGQENIRLIEPLDVMIFHNYLARCHFVLTDSGGIQEEAPSLGKPVLVLRNVTERPEGIEAGTLKLAGCDGNSVYDACEKLLGDKEIYELMSRAANPYGDGHASERICDAISGFANI